MARREQPLIDSLAELQHGIGEFRALLSGVNQPELRANTERFVETALAVVHAQAPEPRATVADDLAGLMTALRLLSMPAQDPDLGHTEALKRLRSGKGLVIAALADALDAARKIDLVPHSAPIPEEMAANIAKAGIADLLDGILRRLKQVEDTLRALSAEEETNPGPPQQRALVDFYVGSMQTEMDMVRLQLTVDDRRVDIGAVARAVEAMSILAGEFVATVKDLGARLPRALASLAKKTVRGVARVSSGLRTIVAHLVGTARKEIDEPQSIPLERPKEFYLGAIVAALKRGDSPRSDWIPWITDLDLRGAPVPTLAPFSELTALQTLHVRSQIADLTPLSRLTALNTLDLSGTQIADLAPLSKLTQLQTLVLDNTQVVDLAPLSKLTELKKLILGSTQVIDLSPLSKLTKLQILDLSRTSVADLAPLSKLAKLQALNLGRSKVIDLSSLFKLTALEELFLNNTSISDLAPLSKLAALRRLNLSLTRVTDLTPLSTLSALQTLDLLGTQIAELAPIATLTALEVLNLNSTKVSDLAALSALGALKILDLNRTNVFDLAALSAAKALETLYLAGTQVTDLSAVQHVPSVFPPEGGASLNPALRQFWRPKR